MLLNKAIGQGVFTVSLGVVAFSGLRLYRPNYSGFYCLANVRHIWLIHQQKL